MWQTAAEEWLPLQLPHGAASKPQRSLQCVLASRGNYLTFVVAYVKHTVETVI